MATEELTTDFSDIAEATALFERLAGALRAAREELEKLGEFRGGGRVTFEMVGQVCQLVIEEPAAATATGHYAN